MEQAGCLRRAIRVAEETNRSRLGGVAFVSSKALTTNDHPMADGRFYRMANLYGDTFWLLCQDRKAQENSFLPQLLNPPADSRPGPTQLGIAELPIAEAGDQMVIDNTSGLQKRIADG